MDRNYVTMLESIGYFGDLNENVFQRFKNGVNNVLAGAGNARASGKVDVGQTMVALEKDYKMWLGANRISNPTRGDFKNFLGFLETKYNLRFGGDSQTPQASDAPQPASNPATQPNSEQAPEAPQSPTASTTATTSTNNPIEATPAAGQAASEVAPSFHGVVQNTLSWAEDAATDSSVSQDDVIHHIKGALDVAANNNQKPEAIQSFQQIAAQHPNTPFAQWVNDALNETTIYEGYLLFEDNVEADDQPFSIQDARNVFRTIAQNNYNNKMLGGAPNPAVGGQTTSAAQPAPQGAGTSSSAPQAAKDDDDEDDATMRMVSVDFMKMKRDFQMIGISDDNVKKLNEFVQQTLMKSASSAGTALENAGLFQTKTQAFEMLVILMRALHNK